MTKENQRSNNFLPWLLYAKVERVEEVTRFWVVLDKQNGLEMLLWRWRGRFFGNFSDCGVVTQGFSDSTAKSYDGALGRHAWPLTSSTLT